MSQPDIELMVEPHADNGMLYMACWPDGDPTQLTHIGEIFLDLVPFMLARMLLSQGYNPQRQLIVRLQGADYDLMRAPLGAAAATPHINFAQPVKQATRAMLTRAQP